MINQETRASILLALGASPEMVPELLDYTHNPFQQVPVALEFPLPDELFVSFWKQISAAPEGVWEALRTCLPQFAFPIRAGISNEESYRQATRRGVWPQESNLATGLILVNPEGLKVQLYPTPVGTIPILVTPAREDFVSLVRAFSHRNEPYPIPDSMGACTVSGFNNWARIQAIRREWEQSAPDRSENAWQHYLFETLVPQKNRYQDRLIILSEGYYSAVSPEMMDCDDSQWRALSFVIRREHECVHYFTLRLFGIMRNNLLDELIADYAGIVAALGHYRADWFLRFMGLEAYPAYRKGGRLENYRGKPPLSDGAFDLLKTIVYQAARTLERFDQHVDVGQTRKPDQAKITLSLCRMTLEALASSEGEALLIQALG